MDPANCKSPENLFEITEVLGEGSYGNVYKGISLADKKTVAIKILPIDEDTSDLSKEIMILEDCKSAHIVKYYGCYNDRENGDFWIVMEYCEAGSMSDLMGINNILIKEKQLAVILKEILIGLKYMHEKKFIHRDIKGGNILLNKDGCVKITDFGVSVKLATTLSKRNTVIGTPFWMAPEVLRESEYDTKADIWSLGITAIELVLGNPPHSELHPMKAIFVIPTKPEPRLPSNFSKKLRDFVRQCCRKDPKRRPTADDLLKHPFIRSAGSSVILKKLFENSIEEIEKFRETYEMDEERDTLKTKKTTNQTKAFGNVSDSSVDSEEDIDPSGTVVINKDALKNKSSEFEKEQWEDDLQLDQDDEFDEDDDELFKCGQGTIIVNKTKSNRDKTMEKYDFTEPRPLKNAKNNKSWFKDTFEFYGKVPKKGHKYVADYYVGLSEKDLETVKRKMEESYKTQCKTINGNFAEEKKIIEYAQRVQRGEQKVLIKD